MTKKLCRVCNIEKLRVIDSSAKAFCSEGYPRKIYIDEKGKRWKGYMCNNCHCADTVNRSRNRGTRKPIDDVKNCSTATGRKSEVIVAEYFKKLGFTPKLTRGAGPDITLPDGTTIEVKTAYKTGRSIVVGAVSERRKKDDILCIVYPDKSIFFDSMESHLKSCCKSGRRTLTSHAREHGKYKGFFS